MVAVTCTRRGARSALEKVLALHSSMRWNVANGRVRMQLAWKSSSAMPDFLAETISENMKSSMLDHATKDGTRIWSTQPSSIESTINDAISTQQDPLDDLYQDRTTRYWPQLPPEVKADSNADPFKLAKGEVENLSKSIREDLLGTDHPVLNKAASYFFGSADGGKKVRPVMVMLLSRALADTLVDCRGSNGSEVQGEGLLFTSPLSWQRPDLPQAQRRLAEISEMIHTASLFHDDVIDGADTRRGMASVHMVFGNKMAILAGDYLLARASICLARLRNVEVVETMSTIIEHLVRGEVMQMRGTNVSEEKSQRMQYYLKKNFYKTGSLMANSCKSAALLGECPQELVAASYRFGKHVGMAFQLADDILDFEGSLSSMGKPALSDLNAGLSTAPVLFAAEQYSALEPLMDRKFKEKDDVERAVDMVFASDGLERTKQLARVHAELAMEAALELADGVHRNALINLAYMVVSRTK